MNKKGLNKNMFTTAIGLFVVVYVLGLHSSIAVMEIASWTISLLGCFLIYSEKRTRPFSIWPLCLGLTLCVFIGLLINPLQRPFFFQMGFLRWMILVYLLFNSLSEVWSAEFENRLINVWSVALVVTALYALFQAFTGIDLIRPAAHVVAFQGGGTWRPVGFFSRSLAFAYLFGVSFLALSLPFFKSRSKFLSIPLLLVGAMTLLATDSRGAWIAFAVAGLIYFAFALPKLLIPFVLSLVAVGAILTQTNTGMGIRLTHMLTRYADNSSMERTHLWQAYFTMWKEHPLFGVGLNQGDLLVPEYYKKLGIQEEFVSNAHNVYLQWLAGAGIFALLLYLVICFYFLRLAWRLRNVTPWGWSIFLAQIFLHVGAFTENNFFTAITNHMVIFCWAILLCLTQRYKADARPVGAQSQS